MAYKIFVSYKYNDDSVFQDPSIKRQYDIWNAMINKKLTPRDYLNTMGQLLSDYAIEKWEADGEDLSRFKDETIQSKLRDKIYDSSITIVLISPHMRDQLKKEEDQWIPWEISYSLRETTRNERTSHANALLAVVLPDAQDNYDYCVESKSCGANILKFDSSFCFTIIGKNFFNNKHPKKFYCYSCKHEHYQSNSSSYIIYTRWKDFVRDPKRYIEEARKHQDHISEFNICKTIY